MRSRKKDLQDVWHCTMEEKRVGLDIVRVFGKPKKYRFTVSTLVGTPAELPIGVVLDYTRRIVSYDMKFEPKEGDFMFVDIEPMVDDEGNLILKDDGYTPVTYPDYWIKRKVQTKNGKIRRYGLAQTVGDSLG